jgi:hypothetical protein
MNDVQKLIDDLRRVSVYCDSEGFGHTPMHAAADLLEQQAAQIEALTKDAERMRRALETVRMYPYFDEGGPLPDMIDAALSGGSLSKFEAMLDMTDAIAARKAKETGA